MKWELLLKCHRGHRYFRAPDGRIAVADDSGATPDRCDDGVLWVDQSREIAPGAYDYGYWVPLIDDKGGKFSTFEEGRHVPAVAKLTGCKVRLPGYITDIVRDLLA